MENKKNPFELYTRREAVSQVTYFRTFLQKSFHENLLTIKLLYRQPTSMYVLYIFP